MFSCENRSESEVKCKGWLYNFGIGNLTRLQRGLGYENNDCHVKKNFYDKKNPPYREEKQRRLQPLLNEY
jgi:hypothetical protein